MTLSIVAPISCTRLRQGVMTENFIRRRMLSILSIPTDRVSERREAQASKTGLLSLEPVPLARYHTGLTSVIEKATRFDDRTYISHRLKRKHFAIQFQRIAIEIYRSSITGFASIDQTLGRFVRV